MKATRIMNQTRLLKGGAILVTALLLLGFVQQIQSKPVESRGYLGVYLENLDDETRESLGYKDAGGVFVDGVVEDSPAEEAGLEDGDIIVKFGDKAVMDEAELRDLIAQTKSGDKVEVEVFREGGTKTLAVEMGAKSDLEGMTMFMKGPQEKMMKLKMMKQPCCGSCGAWLGVEIQDINEQLGEYFKVKDGEGVLVSSVIDDSPAKKAGIKAGDVIVKIDDQATAEASELKKVLCGKKAGDEVAVELVRGGKTKKFKIQLAETPEKYMSAAPMMGEKFKLEGLEGLGSLKDLNLKFDENDLEDLGDMLKDLRIELDEPVKDLQKQMEDLKEEIEKLKVELEKK